MNIKELVIGGVAGAALAVVATQYFGGAQATASAAPAGIAAAPAATVAPAPAALTASVAPAAASADPASAPAAAKAAAAVACPPTLAAVEPRKAASAALPAAMHVDVPAVSLSAEHAWILLSRDQPPPPPPSLPELHARFAGEPLDAGWSQQMEAQLRQGLQDAGIQKGFEVLAVECRRTMCELRLFGNGPDTSQRWSAIAAQLAKQPWWGQNVTDVNTAIVNVNDRSVIATILQRAKH